MKVTVTYKEVEKPVDSVTVQLDADEAAFLHWLLYFTVTIPAALMADLARTRCTPPYNRKDCRDRMADLRRALTEAGVRS